MSDSEVSNASDSGSEGSNRSRRSGSNRSSRSRSGSASDNEVQRTNRPTRRVGDDDEGKKSFLTTE